MPWITKQQNFQLPDWLQSHWQTLALSTRQLDPACCCPSWNLACHSIFHPEADIFYLASNNAAIILAEYMTQEGEPYLGCLDDTWLFANPLLGDRAPDLLLEALPLFEKKYGYIPVLFLSGIEEFTFFGQRLIRILPKNYGLFRHASLTYANASLDGGHEGWLSRRSANHRAKLKKAKAKADAIGIEFERYRPNRDQVASVYQRMLKIEQTSWKGREKCGMTMYPSNIFYERLLYNLSVKGNGLIIFARHDDKDIGFIFGSKAGSYYRGQQFSYNFDYAPYSIGNLMQQEKIRWLCELGVQRYDMGPITGQRMQYKAHWTEEFRKSETWIMRKL